MSIDRLRDPLIGWVEELPLEDAYTPLWYLQSEAETAARVAVNETYRGSSGLHVVSSGPWTNRDVPGLPVTDGSWTRFDLSGETGVMEDGTLTQIRELAMAAYGNAVAANEKVQSGLFGDPLTVVAAIKGRFHAVPEGHPRNRLWTPQATRQA